MSRRPARVRVLVGCLRCTDDLHNPIWLYILLVGLVWVYFVFFRVLPFGQVVDLDWHKYNCVYIYRSIHTYTLHI